MLTFIIKNYCIFYATTYITFKLQNIKLFKKERIIICILPLFLIGTRYLVNSLHSELSYIIPLFIVWSIISFYTSHPKASCVAALIAFGISYSNYTFLSFIAMLVFYPLYCYNRTISYLLVAIITSVMHIFTIFKLLKIKRFQSKLPFLSSVSFINIASIISILLITLLIFLLSYNSGTWLQTIVLLIFVFIFTFLLYWWKTQITKTYKQIILRQQLDSLRTELTEKNKLIIELTEQNKQMGRLIHQDNKMLPAMEQAVYEYLITAENDISSLTDKSNALILEVQNLSRYRKAKLQETNIYDYKKYHTGVPSINMLLNLFSKRSYDEKVIFTVNSSTNLCEHIPNMISDSDFTHLLSNLLDNAFIATSANNQPMIQLQFYISKGAFIIEVADNGMPFEIPSLINFGMKQLTTHADTGGSGIGLMEIWEQKEQCHATLHIEEYSTANPFTKKISIIFNKKNKYIISTYRKTELLNICNRLDLQVYEHTTES